jgi:hypothetical protein
MSFSQTVVVSASWSILIQMLYQVFGSSIIKEVIGPAVVHPQFVGRISQTQFGLKIAELIWHRQPARKPPEPA